MYAFPGDWATRRKNANIPDDAEHFIYWGKQAVEFAVPEGDHMGSDGNVYPVDSSFLGMISTGEIVVNIDVTYKKFVGSIVTFDQPFDVYRTDDTLHFGNLTITLWKL